MNRAFYGWLAGATLSAFGDATLFFALGWAAADLGPHVAGLVLTGYTLPRAVLLLVGGVLGDRLGPRRVLLTCYFLLAFLTLLLALAFSQAGTTATLLLLTAATIGTVEAFALPAAGAFPRLFADDRTLPKAMALRTSTQQVVTLAAGPVGGLLASVAIAGLALSPSPYTAAISGLVQGLGVGLFSSHLAPLFMASTPRSHLTRLQSLLALAQTLPLVASMNLLGGLATAGPRVAVLTCAAGTALAGAMLLSTGSVRTAKVGVS